MKGSKLTIKQEKFCQKVLETGNISDAYRESYNASKMKPETINNKAYILSNKGEVRARIKQLQEEAEKRNEVTIDRILKELKLISFLDPRQLFDENGDLKDVKDLPEDVARAIAEVKVEEVVMNKMSKRVKTTVKMYSKLDAIEKIAKHLGFYQKDNEQQGKSAADMFLAVMMSATGHGDS